MDAEARLQEMIAAADKLAEVMTTHCSDYSEGVFYAHKYLRDRDRYLAEKEKDHAQS